MSKQRVMRKVIDYRIVRRHSGVYSLVTHKNNIEILTIIKEFKCWCISANKIVYEHTKTLREAKRLIWSKILT